MSYLLANPTNVLVVGGPESAVERVRSAVRTGAATGLVAVGAVDEALETLETRDDIGCVVVLEPTERPVTAACKRIHAADDAMPMVVSAPESSCDVATIARYHNCEYHPKSADAMELCTAVDGALARFEERRRQVAESSLFTTLLDKSEISIFAKDERGRYIYKSDLTDDAPPESVIGRTEAEVSPNKLQEWARTESESDLEVVETGTPVYGEIRNYGGNYERWERTTKLPWYHDGEIKGIVGIEVSITQQKIYQRRLEQQSDRVDQFIRHVAHHIRTPLQVVYGSLYRARMGETGAIETAEERIEQVETLVNDLHRLSMDDSSSELSSSSITAHSADAVTTAFVTLLEEIWSVIGTDEAELIVDLSDETIIAAEAETFRPLVFNLLENAIKHAGPDVTVRVGESGPRGFYVADDGPGIPESRQEALLGPEETIEPDGSGTGLDVITETADQQQWHVSIGESQAGGARFDIRNVPMVTVPGPETTPSDPITLDTSEDIGPVSIPGRAEYDPSTDRWTVVANGKNVYGNIHQFHLVHGTASAPVRIEGRVEALDDVNKWSKAGFTIRASTDELAPFGYIGQTGSHGSEVTWRTSEDGFTDSDQFEELPGTFDWYRLDYVDGVVTCYLSVDDTEWMAVDQQPIDLGGTVSVGLLVCSHNTKVTNEATFSDVQAVELDTDRS